MTEVVGIEQVLKNARVLPDNPAMSTNTSLGLKRSKIALETSDPQMATRVVSHRVDGLIRDSGASERHIRLKMSECRNDEWISAAKKFLKIMEVRDAIVALVGGRGTGKTQMSHFAIKEAAKADRTCLYVKAMDMFMHVKDGWDSGRSDKDSMRRFLAPALLVIDELQVRKGSEWENNILSYIIDRRYDALKATVMIANLMPKEFLESVGASIADRLHETGGIIECKWKSFR